MNNTSDSMQDRQVLQDEQIRRLCTRAGSLLDHYGICHGIINTPGIDTHALAWVFTYVRLFALKEIRQDMRHNYQTKDISHLQNELSMSLARAYAGTLSSPPEKDRALDRVFIRNIINFIPRGGGNGDELRLFILDIMRRHGIREGHRPGIDDPFLEQWHQKLHSNCTSEDITICEAYIAFQETNSRDFFYQILWDRGRISRDFLRNMARPLTHEPRYMPQLVPDLKHLLWILKQIHGSSQNLHYLLHVSRWQFDGELFSMLEDVENNFGAWWLPGKIIDCRERLRHYLRSDCPRDPLMIDVALDNIYKASIERIDLRTLSGDDLVNLILLTLRNVQLTYDHEKTASCIGLWRRIKYVPDGHAWSREWGLQALAALTYIQSIIHSYTDELSEFIQPKARTIGESCAIGESSITHFAEEVVRSQNTLCLSKLIDTLFPMVRRTAQVGCWKIISQGRGSATGMLGVAESLRSIQGTSSDHHSQIMLVNTVEGIEEIPPWASAILTLSDVDILSHIAIRCRSSRVILCTCYERDAFERLTLCQGRGVTVSIENGTVHCREAAAGGDKAIAVTLAEDREDSRVTGGRGNGSKSGNLARLREKLSSFITVPSSAVIPYEVFEQTLHGNPESLSVFNELTSQLCSDPENYPHLLPRIRGVIHDLTVPADLARFIQKEITGQEGIVSRWSQPLEKALISHIKMVWGSVWNERAYLSRLARNITSDQVHMRVLVQKTIPADYSFIIHTHNPISGSSSEILSEIVVGLGETLAGNSPGTPWGVVSTRKEHRHMITSYPSKQTALFDSRQDESGSESCIVRSDSNDEDLSDSPGAGLYDSYFINKPAPVLVRYDQEKLFWDTGFQRFLFDSIAQVAEEIEGIMKCPQDIEGMYANGSFYVVQTRSQIV
ncbi:MAG: PEP/pyruvate-binding domain-containing protein [bacterium]